MENIFEAFNTVLGEDFVDEMITRLLIIAGIFVALIVVVIVLLIWTKVAKSNVEKAILIISEYPDDEHASVFLDKMAKINGLSKALAKSGKGFNGLSKSDCRTIFNSTVSESKSLSAENKALIRKSLISIGCTGLLNIS